MICTYRPTADQNVMLVKLKLSEIEVQYQNEFDYLKTDDFNNNLITN